MAHREWWVDTKTSDFPEFNDFNSSDFCVECRIILVDDDRSLGGFCSNCYCGIMYDYDDCWEGN